MKILVNATAACRCVGWSRILSERFVYRLFRVFIFFRERVCITGNFEYKDI